MKKWRRFGRTREAPNQSCVYRQSGVKPRKEIRVSWMLKRTAAKSIGKVRLAPNHTHAVKAKLLARCRLNFETNVSLRDWVVDWLYWLNNHICFTKLVYSERSIFDWHIYIIWIYLFIYLLRNWWAIIYINSSIQERNIELLWTNILKFWTNTVETRYNGTGYNVHCKL